MRDVGIVARVLDDAGAREIFAELWVASAKSGLSPPGSAIVTGSGKATGEQRLERRARRAAGAGPGRPAAPEARAPSVRSCALA